MRRALPGGGQCRYADLGEASVTGPATPELPDELLAALRSPAVSAPQEEAAFEQLYSWVMTPQWSKSVFSPGGVLPTDQYLWSGMIDELSPVPGTTAA